MKLHVVLNSASPVLCRPRSRSTEDGKFVVVSHGTIEQQYGCETVVEAAGLARRQIPGLLVRLPGQGSHVDAVDRIVQKHNLRDVVCLEGPVSEVELSQLLADADVGVVAQLANPYSDLVHAREMYDYMEAGVAVVSSRLTATKSLLPAEVTYFESGNATELANAWVELHRDPGLRLQQVVACRERLNELGCDAQMRHMLRAISDTIASKA